MSVQIPSRRPSAFADPPPPSPLSMCVSSQAHSKCIQITSEGSSIRSEIQYIYILGVDCLCSLWKITIDSLIPTGGRLDLRAGISLIFVFFCGFFWGFFWRESTSLAIYCTNLRSEVKCQTNESKPPDEDYILITSGD